MTADESDALAELERLAGANIARGEVLRALVTLAAGDRRLAAQAADSALRLPRIRRTRS